MKEIIAARLKAARLRAGLTQQQVADAMQWQDATVCYIEGGKRSVRAEELPLLAKIFGTKVSLLMGGL